jgi:hypothetical protein
MSDGMSDAAATGRLGRELEEAAYVLKEKMIAARNGHRGLSIDVLSTVNECLGDDCPFYLAKKAERW